MYVSWNLKYVKVANTDIYHMCDFFACHASMAIKNAKNSSIYWKGKEMISLCIEIIIQMETHFLLLTWNFRYS